MTEAADTPGADQPRKRARSVRDVVLIVLAVAGLVAFFTLASLFRPYTIPSASMEPTLTRGDYVTVSRVRAPKPGDVIVFKPNGADVSFIMRLVGVGGDRVQMKRGEVFINGARLARVSEGAGESGLCWNGAQVRRFREINTIGRSYITYDCGSGGDLDDTPEVVVPADHYFFLGDHRDNANDSRADAGLVPARSIVGKARMIVFSWNRGLRRDRFFKPVE